MQVKPNTTEDLHLTAALYQISRHCKQEGYDMPLITAVTSKDGLTKKLVWTPDRSETLQIVYAGEGAPFSAE